MGSADSKVSKTYSSADDENPGDQTNQGSRPIPDPTTLTTQALLREIRNLREVFGERLDGVDTATKLHATYAEEAIKSIPIQIATLEKLLTQRIDSDKELSTENAKKAEAYRVEQKKDTKDAVDAALAAAKEAVKENNTAFTVATNKSEKAFADQLAQLTVTYNTGIKSTEGKIDDLKERLSRVETQRQTTVDVTADKRSSANITLVAMGVVVAVIVLVVNILIAVLVP